MSDQDPNTPAAEPAAPTLTISDLSLALDTIRAVVQRGAIRAEEMSTVGGLHDRLYAFLRAQGAIADPAPADTSAP